MEECEKSVQTDSLEGFRSLSADRSAYDRIMSCPGLTTTGPRCHVDGPEEKTLDGLRVLQWNVLADGLAQFGDFCRVESKDYLEWSYRAPLLLDRILKDKPHLICVQELNHFGDCFLPELKQHGYEGEFWQKPSSATQRYKFPVDSCALFYKASRLQLLESDTISYKNSRGSKLGQGGQICRFRDADASQDFVVVNTHLKAKGGVANEQLRVIQIRQLLQRINTMTKGSTSTATVLCGDLNADPLSEIYTILHESFVSVYSLSCPCEPPHRANDLEVLEFCDAVIDGGAEAEPLFTTWKFRSKDGEKQRTIDYIWYNIQNKLGPHKRWPTPSQETIGANALPSALFPSDHLPIMCEFRWKGSEPILT